MLEQTKSISLHEAIVVLDHFLFEGKITIEVYGELVNSFRCVYGGRELMMELAVDKHFILN
jgi:hypothetical protein